MPEERKPRDIDVWVGARIAARRMELGLTQSDLAKALGITFQQVQKYERGTNRVSSSKLWLTAEFLGLPLNALFPEHSDLEGDVEDLRAATPLVRKIALEAKRLSPTDQRVMVSVFKSFLREDGGD